MDLSDAETNDSTSSSSFGPGSVEHATAAATHTKGPEAVAARITHPRQAHKGGGCRSSGRFRSVSTPPSYLRDEDGGDESRQEGAFVRGRYGRAKSLAGGGGRILLVREGGVIR